MRLIVFRKRKDINQFFSKFVQQGIYNVGTNFIFGNEHHQKEEV